MGWRTVADVRDYSRATGSAYTVLVMLAERAPDETRTAHPGLKQLALDARTSRSTVQRALDGLEEELKEIEAVAHRQGGRGKATEWRILTGPEMYPTTWAEEKESQDATDTERVSSEGERVASGAERVSSDPVKGRTGDTPKKGTDLEPEEPKGLLPDPADEVFEFWRTTFGRNGNVRFTPERRRAVKARLKDYSVDDLKRAVLGCAGSQFHRDGGHTDLTLICRNGSKVEQFRELPPPMGATGSDGKPLGPEPERRIEQGVPQLRYPGGEWETDYDAVMEARS